MKQVTRLVLALVIGLASVHASAQTQDPHHGHGAPAAAKANVELAYGEVKKVDKSAGKITLKHGKLPRLDMAPMTMVFRVSDPKMLDQVQTGDKIRFDADKVKGSLTITKIEPLK